MPQNSDKQEEISKKKRIIDKVLSFLSGFRTTYCLLLISFLLLSGCASPTFAQSTGTTQPSAINYQPLTNSDQPLPENIPQSSPTYANMIVYNLMHTFSCFVVGQSIIRQPCVEYKMISGLNGVTQGVPVLSSTKTSNGILGFVGSTLDGLYASRPITTSEFIAHMGDSFGIVKTAHAQVGGSGNGVLSPVYSLWVVSRNLCYLLMIIIFLSVGLMIMFRSKINPQTVISIQAALPGLVLGLILITFSYFMASIITDMAFVGTDLVGYFFAQAQPVTVSAGTPVNLLYHLRDQNPLSIIPRFIDSTWNYDFGVGINQVFSNLRRGGSADIAIRMAMGFLAYQYGSQLGSMALAPVGAIVGLVAGFLIPGSTAMLGAGAGSGALGSIGGLAVGAAAFATAYNSPGTVASYLIWILLMVMLLVAMFRLLLTLIKNYLSIIFYTIAAPFFFLAAALPGRSGIVNEWVRNMLCYVLSFPAVIAVIYFAYYMLTGASGNALAIDPQTGSIAPFITPGLTAPFGITGSQTLPLFGGLNLNLINYLLAFGAIIATPSIPDIVCKAIGKIGPYGQIIEQSITGAQKEAGGRIKEATGAPGQLTKDFGNAQGQFTGKTEMRWNPTLGKFVPVREPSPFRRAFRP